MNMRILFAEDEYYLNETVTKKLKQASYSVDSCDNGEDAWDYFEAAEYDLVILDIMMPKLDGLSVLHKIRASGSKVPVILLTAKDAIEDRVKGLDSGANDYLVKPFAMDELLARIRVLLRKVDIAPSNVLKVANLTLELDTQIVKREQQIITLTAKEFNLLRYMMNHVGIVLSRDKLEQHIWNYDYSGGSNVIDVYIRFLRKKIDDGYDPKLIHTIRGQGYVLKDASL